MKITNKQTKQKNLIEMYREKKNPQYLLNSTMSGFQILSGGSCNTVIPP